MMPVIRISDAAFADLRSIAKWAGTKTPSGMIEELVREKMGALGLERDDTHDNHDTGDAQGKVIGREGEAMVFGRSPGLSFTRVHSARIAGKPLVKPNWSNVLLETVRHVRAKVRTPDGLVNELQIPAKSGIYEEGGYSFDPGAGISIQGRSAPDTWKEASRLADKYRIPVEVTFQWRDNDKARYPGRMGIIRAGRQA